MKEKNKIWRGNTQTNINVVICPPCGESVALATKEGQNRKNALWPLLPRLTAVLPPQGREMRRGFTLIELLVVVLIIGILAAMAVPQYQVAVVKSRATKALTLVKALDIAQAVHKLAQEEYATQLAALDIDLPLSAACEEDVVGGNQTGNCFQYNDFHCWLAKNGNGSCMLDGSHKVWIEKYFDRNYYICWVQDQDPISTKVCVLLANSNKIKNRNTFGGHSYEGYNIVQ